MQSSYNPKCIQVPCQEGNAELSRGRQLREEESQLQSGAGLHIQVESE